jgi:hypothetical protein
MLFKYSLIKLFWIGKSLTHRFLGYTFSLPFFLYYSFFKCFESYFTVQKYMYIALNDAQRKCMIYVKYYIICHRAQDVVSDVRRWDNVCGYRPVVAHFERCINEMF